MIIKNIKLENIRSYSNKAISFEMGSTLLSGDIGSGKSSILQAIDFALFGLSRGILSGESLLRYGTDRGSIELNFKIKDKEVKIRRSLKRSSTSVVQDSGFLEINGIREELSAVELKQKILDLLNYPKETLTKKSLIYRYTVYTPQEEMKSILLNDDKYRIDTLRKIFNIDKYKRIKDNSKVISYYLRERIKERETLILDLEDLKNDKKKYEEELNFLNDNLKNIDSKFNVILIKIKDKKNEISLIEEKIKLFNELKKNLELNELDFRNVKSRIDNCEGLITDLTENIRRLEGEVGYDFKIKDYNSDIQIAKNKINRIDKELLEIRGKLSENKINYINSEKVINELKFLNKCPTCKQDVPDEHRHRLIGKEEESLKNFKDNIKNLTSDENKLIKEAESLRESLEQLSNEKNKFEIFRLKRKNLIEKRESLEKINKELDLYRDRIRYVENNISELKNKIENTDTGNYEGLRKEMDVLVMDERKILLDRTSIETKVKNIESILVKLNESILRREKYREELFKLKNLRSFIDGDFVNLIDEIEKKIMLKVHGDFNTLFEKWFNILVDDDNLNVSLNEDFSPLVEQNGHNIDYLYLSGGEKTAGALAYRLALNQVINNVVSNIQTKDLIILDEPTDGFSESQLDRMRVLLEELDISQIIIVSHNPKIESYVDRVVRLNKKEGITEVL